MSKWLLTGSLLVFGLTLLVGGPALAGGRPGAAGPPVAAVTDQIVVRLVAGAALDTAALTATAGDSLTPVRTLTDGSWVLRLPNRRALGLVRALTNRLANRADVVFAEPDALLQPMIVPNDTRWSEQWDLRAPAGGAFGIDAPGAWDVTTGSSAIRVGVIDTGYRPHVDLANRFVPGYDFIGDVNVANDGNGRDADASDPGDWIDFNDIIFGPFAGCMFTPSSWHGTHVSGTIGAASNNAAGVAGINWVSKIQPLRVLGKCGGYTSDIADAIRWGAGLPVVGVPANSTPDRVVNLSLGGSGACEATLQSAIDAATAAGTVVVVAAGNSSADAAGFEPANCNNVVTVAGTGATGSMAWYSNYGATVEIAAPGGDSTIDTTILSTLNDGVTTPGNDSYGSYEGTSMAAPHVAGIVSLMLSANPSLTPAQVVALLQSTATPFPAGSSCTTALCGAGVANAAAAVVAANGGSPPPPLPPGAFGKTSPGNGASLSGTSTTLTWGASSGATAYEWCVSTTSGTCSAWTTTTSTSATVSGLASSTTYFWQVRATNANGTTNADAGTWWSFATLAPPPPLPGAFSKTSPTNGQSRLTRPVTLTWGTSGAATSYEWCVSTTNGSCAAWTSTGSTSASVAGLQSKKTYYWQVRARNANGVTNANAGTWWSFRTR